jgi:G3E family GTPase
MRILILPDRNTADPSPASLLTNFLSGGMTVPNDCKSMDAQRRFFAECRNRRRRNLRQGPGHRNVGRRTGIRTFYHILEHPIAAEDLCTWLALLMDFAGTDLLRLKAIVGVAGWPGPVLLNGEQHMFSAPLTLTKWPTGDHRTRIALVTRNLNEDCLRELLAILTVAVSAGRGSKTPAIQPHPDRTAG